MHKLVLTAALAGGLVLAAAAQAFAASPPNATASWTSGLGGNLGAHSIGLSGFGDGGTTTIPWASATGSDGAVGTGVQHEAAAVITMGPNQGVAGFVSFDPPVTDPVFLVARGSFGELVSFGPDVDLVDSSNVTFNPATGSITFTAAATGSASDGFAVRVHGTFGNVPFGPPGQSQLLVSYSNGSASAESLALTVSSPAPIVDDIAAATVGTTPVTVTPTPTLPPGRTGDVTQTRLIDGSGNALTTLTNADGTWEVDTATGQVTFTPAAGVTGPTAPVTYRVQDSAGIQASATITVDVAPVVGVPMARPLVLAGVAALIAPALFFARRRRRPVAAS